LPFYKFSRKANCFSSGDTPVRWGGGATNKLKFIFPRREGRRKRNPLAGWPNLSAPFAEH
jgi:hypothetical protein